MCSVRVERTCRGAQNEDGPPDVEPAEGRCWRLQAVFEPAGALVWMKELALGRAACVCGAVRRIPRDGGSFQLQEECGRGRRCPARGTRCSRCPAGRGRARMHGQHAAPLQSAFDSSKSCATGVYTCACMHAHWGRACRAVRCSASVCAGGWVWSVVAIAVRHRVLCCVPVRFRPCSTHACACVKPSFAALLRTTYAGGPCMQGQGSFDVYARVAVIFRFPRCTVSRVRS